MSGHYPTDPCFEAVNMTSRWFSVSSQTMTGRIQVRNQGGHRWEFSARYSLLMRSHFGPVYAFLESQRGMLETFTIELPVLSEHLGDVTGTPNANGAHLIGDSTINVQGFSGTLPAGDYIKFSGHDKVYVITSNRTGPGVLNIAPPLVAPVANGEAITFDAVPFTVRQARPVIDYGAVSPNLYEFEVDMVEAV